MNIQEKKETSILQSLIPNYMKWYQALRLNWDSNIESGALKEILSKAGYLNSDSEITFMAMMLTPLVIDELEEPICYFLRTEDSTYNLRASALLAGLLGFKKAIPMLYQIIKESRCDLYDFLQIVKSLFMLNANPREIYNAIMGSVEHSKEDQAIRLAVLAALQADDKGLIANTVSLVEKMEDEEYKTYTALMFLNDWNEKGINIPAVEELIQAFPNYCSDKMVKWLKTYGGKKEVLEKIFAPLENESFCFELVCRALSEPGEWGFLESYIEGYYDSWSSGALESYLRIAFMLLLLQSRREYKKVQSDEDWCHRTAVYLYLAGKGKTAELEAFAEEDRDAKRAIQFSLFINLGIDDCFKNASIMHLYREMTDYRMDRICSSLVQGLGLEDQYPELSLDYALNNKDRVEDIEHWIEKAPKWFLHRVLNWEPPLLSELLNPLDRQALNIFLLLVSTPAFDISSCLEENFMSQSDYDRGEIIAYIASLNSIRFHSTPAAIKEMTHYSLREESPLSREEMEDAYDMLFDNALDDKYKVLLLGWISPLLTEKINKSYSLLRSFTNESFQDFILTHMLPDPSISSRVGRCNCLKLADTQKLLLLIDKYGMRTNFIPWILRLSKSKSLEHQEILSLLQQALDVSSDNEAGKSLLKEIASYVSSEDFYHLINNRFLLNPYDSLIISYIEENPEPVYLGLAFNTLYSEDFSYRQSAFNSIRSIKNKEFENEEYFIFSNDDENDEDSFSRFYEKAEEHINDPAYYKSIKEQQFIVKLCRAGNELEAQKNQISDEEWMNLFLYLSVDFIDEKDRKLVCRVSEEKNGELLNWFLEQGDHHFYVVQKA